MSVEEIVQSPRRYDYSPPKRMEQSKHMADRALHMMGNSNAGSPGDWHSPTGNDRTHYWNHDRDQSETITVAQNGDQDDYDDTPPPGQVTDGTGTPPTRPGGPVIQIAKRKRNFSNRTKTGCMTCRSRKKKCDEGRPTCKYHAPVSHSPFTNLVTAGNNCQRGGFECQGYTTVRGVWPGKSNGSKGPIPLQAKDGQPGNPDLAYQNNEPHSAHPSSQHTTIPRQGITEGHGEVAPPQYAQAAEPRSRSSYPGQPWPPQQGHPPYNDQLPPLSELARNDTSKSDYPPTTAPVRDMSRPTSQHIPHPPPAPNPQSGHWHQPPPHPEYRQPYAPPPPPRIDTHQPPPPMRVQTSSYDYQKSGAKTFTVEEVERSRMLRHTRFNYFDPTLKNERQRCAEALARYNAACMLRSGVTEQEAQNMLMKVFDPSLDTTHSFLAPCKEKGHVGPGVKIEGPFKCTYGYNLRVRDSVFIGEGTRIDDSARVDIGARTWIGPNVTILTTDVSKDMVDRKGTESGCIAMPVTIAPEVVIGANAVIYPGVTLGHGSTVEAFAVVKEPLGDNQVQRAPVGPRLN